MLLDSVVARPKKIALIGDSAVGKTTAVGTLANAGFEVGILDVDNGYAVLADPLRIKPENRKNVHIEHVDISDGAGWENLGKALNGSWDGWGPVGSWGKSRIFCLDSGSIATKMVFRHVCKSLNVSTDIDVLKMQPKDSANLYHHVSERFFCLVARLNADETKCHVVVTYHLRNVTPLSPNPTWVIASDGTKLHVDLPKLYPDIWHLTKLGKVRTLLTASKGIGGELPLKCSTPSLLSESETLTDGLAGIFLKLGVKL